MVLHSPTIPLIPSRWVVLLVWIYLDTVGVEKECFYNIIVTVAVFCQVYALMSEGASFYQIKRPFLPRKKVGGGGAPHFTAAAADLLPYYYHHYCYYHYYYHYHHYCC